MKNWGGLIEFIGIISIVAMNPCAAGFAQVTFTDVTTVAGVCGRGRGWGTVFFDYDNDGDLDIYAANAIDTNVLYRNNGDGTFTDVSILARVNYGGASRGVPVGDFDNDGYVDIFLANAGSDLLYHNNGDGTFTDVTASAGITENNLDPRSAVCGDYDNDGNLDIYVSNWGQNALWHNNGDSTFTNLASDAGVGHTGMGSGTASADFDNDGDLDICITTWMEGIYLYRNNGNGTFTDVTTAVGIEQKMHLHGLPLGTMTMTAT